MCTILLILLANFGYSQDFQKVLPDSNVWHQVDYQDSSLILKLVELADQSGQKLIIYSHQVQNVNAFHFTKYIVNDSLFIEITKADYMLFQMNSSDRRPLDPENIFYDTKRGVNVKIHGHIFQYCLTRLLNYNQVIGPLLIIFNEDGSVLRTIDETDFQKAEYSIEKLMKME